MNALSSFARPATFVLLFFAGLLLPLSAERSGFPSARPPSACRRMWAPTRPSQTVRVKQRGKPTAQVVGCAGKCELAQRIADERRERRYTTLTFTTSALAAGQYQTSFRVESATGSAITVNVQAS